MERDGRGRFAAGNRVGFKPGNPIGQAHRFRRGNPVGRASRFQPGCLGNPGGLTKGEAMVKALKGDGSEAARKRLRELMRSGDPRTDLAACKAVLALAGTPVEATARASQAARTAAAAEAWEPPIIVSPIVAPVHDADGALLGGRIVRTVVSKGPGLSVTIEEPPPRDREAFRRLFRPTAGDDRWGLTDAEIDELHEELLTPRAV